MQGRHVKELTFKRFPRTPLVGRSGPQYIYPTSEFPDHWSCCCAEDDPFSCVFDRPSARRHAMRQVHTSVIIYMKRSYNTILNTVALYDLLRKLLNPKRTNIVSESVSERASSPHRRPHFRELSHSGPSSIKRPLTGLDGSRKKKKALSDQPNPRHIGCTNLPPD